MEVVLAIGIFALCMAGLGLGLILNNRCLRGSCGGVNEKGEAVSCSVCETQKGGLCPTEDETGLMALARIAEPNPHHEQRENLAKVIPMPERHR